MTLPVAEVYNVTHWHAFHPGGSTVLLKYGGKDATKARASPHHVFFFFGGGFEEFKICSYSVRSFGSSMLWVWLGKVSQRCSGNDAHGSLKTLGSTWSATFSLTFKPPL